MNPAYFETRFRVHSLPSEWPSQFVILSAYATTGESWPAAENEAADTRLRLALVQRGRWFWRLVGYSPTTGHAEPSWATAMLFDSACDLGGQFHQDALYLVDDDQLFVSYCDDRRQRLPVGPFRERLDVQR